MTTPGGIADRLAHELRIRPNVPIGALRFYGQWFGIPFDTRYRIASAQAEADLLVIQFDRGERLAIAEPMDYEWRPTNWGQIGPVLVVRAARVVRWEFVRSLRTMN